MADFLVDVARLALWLALLAAVFVPLERLFAVRAGRLWRKSTGVDLAYYFLNSLVPAALLAGPLALLALASRAALPEAWLAATAALPLAAKLGLGLLASEIGAYWGHRWCHASPLLWRFHAVHHSAEHIDWLVNTRAHPLDMAFNRLCGLVPLYALGLAQPTASGPGDLVAVYVTLIGTVWTFFIHANVRWRFGPLEALVSTPAFHHWHHTNCEHRDRNFAALLPWLDRLFGTHYLPRGWPSDYGVDQPVAPTLGGQLLDPLRSPARTAHPVARLG